MTTNWDAVSAVSTAGAVVVALGLSVVPGVWRWHRRPRLDLTIGRVEPYAVAVHEGTALAKQIVLRLGIHNSGVRTAEGAWVRVMRRWYLDGAEWILEVESLDLGWAGASKVTTLDIPADSTMFVELIRYERRDQSVRYLPIGPPEYSEAPKQTRIGLGDYRVEVLFGASELAACSAVIAFTFNYQRWLTRVERSEEPPNARQLGLLNLFELASASEENPIGTAPTHSPTAPLAPAPDASGPQPD